MTFFSSKFRFIIELRTIKKNLNQFYKFNYTVAAQHHSANF